jgi:hypothetical protein
VRRLEPGEQLIGVGGLALFAVSFFGWLGGRISTLRVNGANQSIGAYHVSGSAWNYTLTLIAVLLGVSMLVYIGFRVLGLDPPETDTPARVLTALGALAFLFIVIKLIVGANITVATFGIPDTSGLGAVQVGITTTREFGIYAGAVASAALAYGGYLTMRR